MRILDDELVWQHNSTMNGLVTFHKDYIIKQYERLAKEETTRLKSMIEREEKFQGGEPLNRNVLPIGTFVNACALVSPRSYLSDYMLTFDPSDPENEKALIATITQREFKESLLHTDDAYVEKIVQFSKQIPGFQNVSRSSARKIFYLFTHQRVKKGWQMHSYDRKSTVLAGSANKKELDWGLPPQFDPQESKPSPGKVYVIMKGSFSFQCYNKKMPSPGIRPSRNRV